MAVRNPLTDPQPGDIVRSVYASLPERHVLRRCGHDIIYAAVTKEKSRERLCLLGVWRTWCRRSYAVVVQRADAEVT